MSPLFGFGDLSPKQRRVQQRANNQDKADAAPRQPFSIRVRSCSFVVHLTSTAFCGHTTRHVSHRVHFASSITCCA